MKNLGRERSKESRTGLCVFQVVKDCMALGFFYNLQSCFHVYLDSEARASASCVVYVVQTAQRLCLGTDLVSRHLYLCVIECKGSVFLEAEEQCGRAGPFQLHSPQGGTSVPRERVSAFWMALEVCACVQPPRLQVCIC